MSKVVRRKKAQGPALSLVRVPFKDGWIEAGRDEAGAVWVPLRRFCELLGLSVEGQQQRLRRQPWAVTRAMHATGPDGKQYEVVAVDDTTFAMWLATIQASRVKPEVRPHLEEHQREAARALRAYFFPAAAAPASAPALGEAPAPDEARQVLGGANLDEAQRAALDALLRIAESSAPASPGAGREREVRTLLRAASMSIEKLQPKNALANIRGALALLGDRR